MARYGRLRRPVGGTRSIAAEQEQMLRMEFRTFVSSFIRIPCQIINTGRKLVYRLLGWNAWQGTFYRMAAQFCRPLRC